jgi:hypothetical protein
MFQIALKFIENLSIVSYWMSSFEYLLRYSNL